MAINSYFTWVGIITPFFARHMPCLPRLNKLFGQLIEQQITGGFAQHPDFSKIDWSKVQYTLDSQTISPESTKTLVELGFGHKSLLRFVTPELNGYNDSYV